MLVLSRFASETIRLIVPPSDIPTEITVMVIEIRRDKTRLGFQAPKNTIIHREEIWDEIERERLAYDQPTQTE